MSNIIASLLSKVSPMGQMLQQATGIAQALQTGNPLQIMGQNNPQMKQVLDYIQQNGGNAEQALYNLARQKGVDPNEAIRQAQSFLNSK